MQSHPLCRTHFNQCQASYQLCWGDWEMGTATRYHNAKCSHAAGLMVRRKTYHWKQEESERDQEYPNDGHGNTNLTQRKSQPTYSEDNTKIDIFEETYHRLLCYHRNNEIPRSQASPIFVLRFVFIWKWKSMHYNTERKLKNKKKKRKRCGNFPSQFLNVTVEISNYLILTFHWTDR